MNKQLTTKIQQLSPIPTESATVLSKTVVVEPEDKALSAKKGCVYAVYTISDSRGFDHSLIGKVVYDVLNNDYYQTESISPIQSLEKILIEVRNKVMRLSNESISNDEHQVSFDIVAAVLWGNVMYITKYGEGHVVLMRNSEIKELETITEGGFSVTSGIVKDEDVLILATSSFFNNYPPDKLMATPLGERDLKAEEACILMKLKVNTNLSEEEQVDFGVEIKKKPVIVSQIKDRLKRLVEKRANQKDVPLETIASKGAVLNMKLNPLKTKAPVESIGIKLERKKRFKFKPIAFIPIVAAALIVSVVLTIKDSQQKVLKSAEVEGVVTQTQPTEDTPEIQPKEDIDNEAFYDLKIADAQAEPKELTINDNRLIVIDTKNGTVYSSDTQTPKFEKLSKTYTNITSIETVDELTWAAIQNTNNTTDFVSFDNKVLEKTSYSSDTLLSKAAYYLDFIYALKGNSILKYTKDGTALSSSTWGTAADFEEAKDYVVAYSIWLITKDNTIVKYTGGQKDTFTLQNNTEQLQNPVAIATKLDFENIYIADKALGKILAFDKQGKFVQEYGNSKWTDINDIAVDTAEKTLYILSGSRLYKISL